MSNSSTENIRAREAWDMNARFWDERMAEGNDFFISLIWPSVEKLLRPTPGEKFLDIACGNGLTSRRLAQAGADVVAFDFSEEMIRAAGFSRVAFRNLTGGIAAIHSGWRT